MGTMSEVPPYKKSCYIFKKKYILETGNEFLASISSAFAKKMLILILRKNYNENYYTQWA